MMRCDVIGLLTNGAKHNYQFPLVELGKNLRQLRDRCSKGDLVAIAEFFDVYVFPEDDTTNGEHVKTLREAVELCTMTAEMARKNGELMAKHGGAARPVYHARPECQPEVSA